MLIYKKFKVFTVFSMVLIFLTAISDTIIAENKVASNDLGSFYINNQNVLYFKGTLNGQTYTDYVPLTGANNATGIDASSIEGASQIYASGDTFSVIDSKGNLFGYGANLEHLYGTSGTNSAYSYLGGSIDNKIVNVSLTTHGSAFRAEDGSVSVRKANLNDDNTYSGAAQDFASYTSPLVTDEGTFNSHFDVKVFRDGAAFIPVDVNNTDFIKSHSPNVLQTRSQWDDPTRIHFNYDHTNANIQHGATYENYDGFTLNGEDYVVMHVKNPHNGPKVADTPMNSIVMIGKGGPGEYRNWQRSNMRDVSKVDVNDGIITMVYEDGEIVQSAPDDPFRFEPVFNATGKLETEHSWGEGGKYMMKDPDGTVYFSRGREGGHNIMKIDTEGTVSKIVDNNNPVGGIARSPSGELVFLDDAGVRVVNENTGEITNHESMSYDPNSDLRSFEHSDIQFDDDGTMYIEAGDNQSRFLKWTPGQTVADITPERVGWGGGGKMAFDPSDENIIWRNSNHGMLLQKLDKNTGEVLQNIDLYTVPHPHGSDWAGNLDPVRGLTVDSSGKIHFVSNRGQYGVLDPDTMAVTDMDMHRDMDGSDGIINPLVDYYNDGTKTVPAWSSQGANSWGPMLKAPMDILLEDDGTVLVLQGSNTVGSLRRLTPTSLAKSTLPEGLDVQNITDAMIDNNGDLLLYNNNDIYSFSSQSSAFSLAQAVNPLYDDNGFDATGLHRDTGNQFDLAGLTKDGGSYVNGFDAQGFDQSGYNANGFDVQGFDTSGYNANGFDAQGFDTSGVSADGLNARNGELAKEFELRHSVARESYFKTTVKTAQISSDALRETNLGELRVRNNTRDGYELTLSSATGGVLQPSGSSSDRPDGEVDIPYTISLTKAGEIGTGIDNFLTFSSNALANAVTGVNAVHILKKAGIDGSSAVSSATDAVFQLNIKMESNTDALGMAGTYADILTLTYSDL